MHYSIKLERQSGGSKTLTQEAVDNLQEMLDERCEEVAQLQADKSELEETIASEKKVNSDLQEELKELEVNLENAKTESEDKLKDVKKQQNQVKKKLENRIHQERMEKKSETSGLISEIAKLKTGLPFLGLGGFSSRVGAGGRGGGPCGH